MIKNMINLLREHTVEQMALDIVGVQPMSGVDIREAFTFMINYSMSPWLHSMAEFWEYSLKRRIEYRCRPKPDYRLPTMESYWSSGDRYGKHRKQFYRINI